MGSGLGRKCEQVLGQVDRRPGKWVRLTAAAGSASEASGLRRAAHTLERRGLIELKKHHNEKGTWLVARRKSDELIPEDLARILGPERVRTALDSYASCSPTQWRRRISGSYDFLKDELWKCFLASGMTIDEAKGLILMMGGKR